MGRLAVELILKPSASLQYFHLQDFARDVWHSSTQTALLDKDASLTWLNGTLGSQSTKAFLDCKFLGAGGNAKLLGFFFGDGKQHFDQHTFQNHLVGHTESDLLYKGALKDEAYSAYRGLIRVSPDAQRSDAYQANRNILLSPKAHADSIPELEIEANDVRCMHGSTVGPIDPEQIFYLQARGIQLPWTILDDLHRATRDRLVAQFGITGLTEADLDHINRGWHRLSPGPTLCPALPACAGLRLRRATSLPAW